MIKASLNILSLTIILVTAACSHPKDPFQNRQKVPEEICFTAPLKNMQYEQAKANMDAQNEQLRIQAQNEIKNNGLIRADAPKVYTVKKGDTLWDISKRFLKKPWLWKSIWHNNPQIKNPHRIYPGDKISLINVNGETYLAVTSRDNVYLGHDMQKRTKDGRPILRYSPHVRSENLKSEPLSIAANSIEAHILKTRLLPVGSDKLLPFIYGYGQEYLTLTAEQEIFAQRLESASVGDEFYVYRPHSIVYDPHLSKDDEASILGQEMRHIGKVVVTAQNPADGGTKLHILEALDVLKEGDVLLATESENEVENYFPQLPGNQCSQGHFVANTAQSISIKEFDSVITSFGRNDGAKVGDIWKIVRPSMPQMINGATVTAPAKEVGYLMIYRVEEKVSFGFVLESSQNIYLTDTLVKP